MTSDPVRSDYEPMLHHLQCETYEFFRHETSPDNGLVADSTKKGAVCSIAATGMALASNPVAVERGFCTREAAKKHTLTALRFFAESEQSQASDATGYYGFYYHFLDMATGKRAWDSELSTIDSSILLAGMLTARAYFDRPDREETEIRTLADHLYDRVDWQWAQNGGLTVSHGWSPESGFLPYRWEGYDEALLLYVLGLGSATHALSADSYEAWLSTYQWKTAYGQAYVYAGPLFIHQFSHIWIDFRGIQDAYMRERGIDYFENSRRATLAQQAYAKDNPGGFPMYGEWCWGITSSDGPGDETVTSDGVEYQFHGYIDRGAPLGIDDGTLSPWAVAASLPFAPEIVLPTLRHLIDTVRLKPHKDGFEASFNALYPVKTTNRFGWVAPHRLGINQGPIILMVENYRSGLVWRLMRSYPPIARGLRRAGFTGGWL